MILSGHVQAQEAAPSAIATTSRLQTRAEDRPAAWESLAGQREVQSPLSPPELSSSESDVGEVPDSGGGSGTGPKTGDGAAAWQLLSELKTIEAQHGRARAELKYTHARWKDVSSYIVYTWRSRQGMRKRQQVRQHHRTACSPVQVCALGLSFLGSGEATDTRGPPFARSKEAETSVGKPSGKKTGRVCSGLPD